MLCAYLTLLLQELPCLACVARNIRGRKLSPTPRSSLQLFEGHVVVDGLLPAASLSDGMALTTLAGPTLTVSVADDGTVSVAAPNGGSSASVILPDIVACDTVIHLIDDVLVPGVAPATVPPPTVERTPIPAPVTASSPEFETGIVGAYGDEEDGVYGAYGSADLIDDGSIGGGLNGEGGTHSPLQRISLMPCTWLLGFWVGYKVCLIALYLLVLADVVARALRRLWSALFGYWYCMKYGRHQRVALCRYVRRILPPRGQR